MKVIVKEYGCSGVTRFSSLPCDDVPPRFPTLTDRSANEESVILKFPEVKPGGGTGT